MAVQWAGIGDPTWVGLDNYAKLFSDRSFLASGGNTLIFVLASVFVVMPLALVAATALNARGLRERDMFRVGYFLPSRARSCSSTSCSAR